MEKVGSSNNVFASTSVKEELSGHGAEEYQEANFHHTPVDSRRRSGAQNLESMTEEQFLNLRQDELLSMLQRES